HEVLLPAGNTNTGRVMVKASDNVFFAINAADFVLEPSEMVLDFEALEYLICQGDDLIVPFAYDTQPTFTETTTFSATVPTGMTASFNPPTANAGGTQVQLTLSNTAAVTPGIHEITVIASSASLSREIPLSINIQDGNFAPLIQ